MEEEPSDEQPDGTGTEGRAPYRVRLPRFVTGDEETGLGDVIKRATSAVGIRPCGGCAERAAALNRLMAFTPRRQR